MDSYAKRLDDGLPTWLVDQELKQSSWYEGLCANIITEDELRVVGRFEQIVYAVYETISQKQGVAADKVCTRLANHVAYEMYRRHFGTDCTDTMQSLHARITSRKN